MAAGKRYKWQGSTIQFLTAFDASSPSNVITAITKANPAVVTYTGVDPSNGDVIQIQNVVGMDEVNLEQYIIDNVNTGAKTLELVDVDSTGYGTYVSGGIFDVGSFSNFCELTGYNRTGGTSPEIDATTICSTAAEFETGLPDFGSTALDYNFAPQTAIQTSLEEFHTSGEKTAVKITLPKSGGIMVLLGFVQQTSEQASNGTLWTGSATLRNTGRRFDLAA
jgi:hypothetical protein